MGIICKKIKSLEKKTISKIELKSDILSSNNLEEVSQINSVPPNKIEANIADQSKIEKLIKKGVDE